MVATTQKICLYLFLGVRLTVQQITHKPIFYNGITLHNIILFPTLFPYKYPPKLCLQWNFFLVHTKTPQEFPPAALLFTRVPRSYLTKVILRICEKSPASRL